MLWLIFFQIEHKATGQPMPPEMEELTSLNENYIGLPANWSIDTTSLLSDLIRQNRSLVYLSLEDSILHTGFIEEGKLCFEQKQVYAASLERKVDHFLRLINLAFPSPSQQRKLTALSRELYQELLGSFEGYLEERVDIIVDGILSGIPFAALRVDQSGNQPIYFGNLHTLNYHLSFQMRETTSNRQLNPLRRQVFALAPSFETSYLPEEPRTTTRKENALANNQHEVAFIQQLLPGEYLFGASATREEFDRKVTDYAVVHLATHAEADLQDGRRSKIFLSGSHEGTENILYAGEIPAYNLNAELVVLSACETGTGSYHDTKGLVGLTQSFLLAGSKAVVSSRWAVEDRATAEIMASFYTYLKNGISKDLSLRLAQQEYRLRHAGTFKELPFYWAAFNLYGDPSPLKFRSHFYYNWWKWGIVVIVFLFGRHVAARKIG